MRLAVLILSLLFLSGCATRLLPKIEKIDLPEELMVPPKPLKTIEKPIQPKQEKQESNRDAPPK